MSQRYHVLPVVSLTRIVLAIHLQMMIQAKFLLYNIMLTKEQ